jgi:flagellar basal-body rod modification protein FlgD
MEIGSSNSTGSAVLGGATATPTSDSLGPDAFLRLLVTQIRNQDPMEPMDTEGMMQQLTQLSSVERLVAIDDRLASLSVATAGIGNGQAADFVGRTVEADTSRLTLVEGGPLEGAFELPASASSVSVEIRDEAGNLVRTLSLGAQGAGAQRFTWDGRSDDGELAPAGRYHISVDASTEAGTTLDVAMRARGVVDAVRYDAGYPELSIDGFSVMLGDVRSVADAPAPAPTDTTTTP